MSDLVKIADAIAEKLHAGQTRKGSGAPYITHPRRVAELLSATGGPVTIAAGLLHDVIEDCNIHCADLVERLVQAGAKPLDAAMVGELVWQLTSLDKFYPSLKKLKRADRKEIQRERLRYCCSTAVIIKVYDRCDNLSEMDGLEPDFQRLYIEESEQLFDVASRALGYTWIKVLMTDAIDTAMQRLKDNP